jgi:hypothetical protein
MIKAAGDLISQAVTNEERSGPGCVAEFDGAER